jgi:hypothetical protein
MRSTGAILFLLWQAAIWAELLAWGFFVFVCPFSPLHLSRACARIHAGLLFGDTSYTKLDYQQVTEMFTRTNAHTSGRTKCRTNVGQTNIFFLKRIHLIHFYLVHKLFLIKPKSVVRFLETN